MAAIERNSEIDEVTLLLQWTMALAAHQGQVELLAGQLATVGAERDKLTREKLVLFQENATLHERSHADGRAGGQKNRRDRVELPVKHTGGDQRVVLAVALCRCLRMSKLKNLPRNPMQPAVPLLSTIYRAGRPFSLKMA